MRRTSDVHVVVGLAITALLLVGCDRSPRSLAGLQDSCEDCNVVVISLDTLRADHLGTYGYERDTSPNLDAIARRGVLYESCYAQAPVTLISHMSIFTGLYPRRHGVVTDRLVLPEKTPTLTALLRQRGYATAAFTGGGYVRERFGYHGFDRFEHSRYWDASYRSENQQFQKMLDWVDTQTDPFFLFWHSYRVHSPYNPPSETDRFSDPGYDGIVSVDPDTPVDVCADVQARGCQWKGLPYYERLLDSMSRSDVQHVVDKYDGEILSLDALVGRLWGHLEERGLLTNTVVVITSDHGESFAERERNAKIGHGLLYREVLHVPLIVYAPGIEGPHRRSELVETIDIMPTVLDLVGIAKPSDIDGHSLAGEEAPRRRRFAFAEDWDGKNRTAVSIIHGSRYLIDWRVEQDELFDLATDFRQRQNVIEEHAATAERLRRIVMRIAERPSVEAIQGGELDDETLRELDALGYL